MSHRVQQLLSLFSRQQAEAGGGPQDNGGGAPHGGRDAGFGHLQKLQDSSCTLDRWKGTLSVTFQEVMSQWVTSQLSDSNSY